MFVVTLVRVDFLNGIEVRTNKATFIGNSTDECMVPLREWFDEKERRVRTYLADNFEIYPVFELNTTQTEQVVLVDTPILSDVRHD